MRTVRIFMLVLCMLSLVSCEALRFYTQAISGQLSILTKRRNIESLVLDPSTDEELRARLQDILAIRKFAEAELALPVEKNFSTYVDTGRSFVVWNVFATPEFSMTPEDWCFPIAGCVTYRGYFKEASARKYAEKIDQQGKDVYVGGVSAYSTLGWFSDSVLNTVINRDKYRLAALIFHELAHQVVYIPGDTEFNESFATAVELEGLQRWLAAEGEFAEAEALVEREQIERKRRREFVALVKSVVPPLKAVYHSDTSPAQMRLAKQQIIAELRERYELLKESWDGYAAYDSWIATEINNAKINTVSTYFNRVPAFSTMLADVGHHMPEFYQRVETLSRKPLVERRAMLEILAERGDRVMLESASRE